MFGGKARRNMRSMGEVLSQAGWIGLWQVVGLTRNLVMSPLRTPVKCLSATRLLVHCCEASKLRSELRVRPFLHLFKALVAWHAQDRGVLDLINQAVQSVGFDLQYDITLYRK